ncbi:MAG: nuclear transport factor 2 family protein [Actinomycetota bacterium]|nr:nuclear transport factor 2 family protein [Actinomycetota bacterium]
MNRKLANATGLYMEGIRDGRVREAVEAYTGDRYTQHSTGVADGVEGFVAFFEPFVERTPVRDIRVIRSIVDGDFVFVQVYQDLNNGEARWITTDLFDTDENDKIVEHWDVIAAVVDDSVNGRTQFDGPTAIADEDRTEQNKALVAAFIDDVLVNHRVDAIARYVSSDRYVQHNPAAPDGIEAFQEFMMGPGQDTIYRDVFKIIGQGNFVMAYSHVFLGEELAVFDLFRVEDGRIVEHWDNVEPLPEGPQPNSGKF